ncbi:sensor histidine kinase [Mesorhizobium captivum]|uniref:sensor histidine kinase n=1 Tax=Mesorhizobium captivum TaxID=3072319 RepID=UPI002A24B059|nr:ATP-binding protein [Mesorhizobium sp. VK23E]MDX8514453.1 ATP-binding protein [Mesorhizobium sp. VK23E]
MSRKKIKMDVFDRPADVVSDGPPMQLSTAGVVHDLGNLIQVASSALNRLARDPSVSATPALMLAIASARTALERAGGLVRHTISLARDGHTEIEHTNVAVCLAEIETFIRTTWDPNIRLEVRARSELPLAKCDRMDLQNAILNLVFNARDAMPNGGLISIDAAAIVAGSKATRIDLRVTDNGIGMSRETIACAFDPFFTTKGEGLGGVGLPMVKRFAEQSGGSVEIKSTLGSGTTVILRLPAMRSDIDATRSVNLP